MDIINNLDISEKSKTNYRNILKILERDGYNFSFTVNDTILFLSNYPIQTALNLLNVIFVIRKALDQDMKSYIELRASMQQEQSKQTHEKLSELKLMDSKEYLTLMNDAFNNKEYLKFVLNYLCYNYGIRNEDLRVTIGSETKGNFLIKNKVGVAYIRQAYKTFSTYGIKKHIIKNKQFVEAFKQLPEGIIYEGHMSNFLKKYLILPEGQIFKMRIRDLETEGNTKEIKQLAEDRGTSIPTVLSNYNINTSKYVIK